MIRGLVVLVTKCTDGPQPSIWIASQKKNLTLGGTVDRQMSFAPSNDDIPTKKDRYAEDAEYWPLSVQRQTNLSDCSGCN